MTKKPKNELTQECLKEALSYDPLTGNFVWIKRRGGRKFGAVAGCLNSYGYRVITVWCNVYTAHRLAWLYVHGVFPNGPIDHINGSKDDNRIANLREATELQNSWNQCHKPGVSGHKNVVWRKKRKRWQVRMHIRGKKTCFGSFISVEEAAAAACAAREKYHGEFANHG